jgi:ribosomal protein L4
VKSEPDVKVKLALHYTRMRREDTQTLDLEVRRDDLGTARVREGGLPQLRDGEVLLPPTAKA